ncbi:hypothetical protein BDR06DRAFT_1053232 [Suillus hirtellus]|nr:hypothetical protein BDR06DRAFT_1053232 [Suillus hirtellus]
MARVARESCASYRNCCRQLRPHCLAKDRLQLWLPLHSCSHHDSAGAIIPVSEDDLNHILSVIGHSLAVGTQETYGSGLLAFHVFCDARGISEEHRGPASSVLLLTFIANCAGTYSGKTLENYFYGVHAWHLLHGLDWLIDQAQTSLALTGCARLAPPSSKHPKRHPFTASILVCIHSTLDISAPLDSAFYACLVVGFFSLARLGELTIHSLQVFDPSLHVKMSDVHHVCNHQGLDTTVVTLPCTKTSLTGEDIYFAAQSGVLDPVHALAHHFSINSPSPSSPLFSWRHSSGLRPLTRSEFLRCLERASNRIGTEPLKGHGLHIGGTLEYLLRDLFTLYLQQHAVVLAPYLQDTPILEPFTRYTMPCVR